MKIYKKKIKNHNLTTVKKFYKNIPNFQQNHKILRVFRGREMICNVVTCSVHNYNYFIIILICHIFFYKEIDCAHLLSKFAPFLIKTSVTNIAINLCHSYIHNISRTVYM